MGKKGKKRVRRTRRPGAPVTLEAPDVKELQAGMRKLLRMYDQRKRMNRALAKLDDNIRSQRQYNEQILASNRSTAPSPSNGAQKES